MIVVILGSCTKDKTIPPEVLPIDRSGIYSGMKNDSGSWATFDSTVTYILDTAYLSQIIVSNIGGDSIAFLAYFLFGDLKFAINPEESYEAVMFGNGISVYDFQFLHDTLSYHYNHGWIYGTVDENFWGLK